MPAFSNTNSFVPTKPTKHGKPYGRIRDIGELYLRILFCTYIFNAANVCYLTVKMIFTEPFFPRFAAVQHASPRPEKRAIVTSHFAPNWCGFGLPAISNGFCEPKRFTAVYPTAGIWQLC
jgi:hypothetical protein